MRQQRELVGLTVHQVAEQVGVSASYISRLERGQQERPSSDVATRLAQVLRVPPKQFRKVAGIFEEDDRRAAVNIPTFQQAVVNDENLTREQKRAFLDLYRSLVPGADTWLPPSDSR